MGPGGPNLHGASCRDEVKSYRGTPQHVNPGRLCVDFPGLVLSLLVARCYGFVILCCMYTVCLPHLLYIRAEIRNSRPFAQTLRSKDLTARTLQQRSSPPQERNVSIYIYIYTCVYIYIHMCMCTHFFGTYTHVCLYVCMHVGRYVCVCICICMCIYIYICICMSMYMSMYICMYL